MTTVDIYAHASFTAHEWVPSPISRYSPVLEYDMSLEVFLLMRHYANLWIYAAGTKTLITMENIKDFFPEYDDGTTSSGGGGDSGTTNYNDLENKPKINNIPLVGDKSTADLDINIPDVSDFITDTEVEELLADYVTETVFDSTIAGFYTKSETDALLTTKADKSTTYTKSETDAHIAEKVAEIVADAPEDFDTLKEMSDWIEHHEESASAMNSAIQANAVAISGKVDAVSGKGLSTEDYTPAEKTKLANLENYDDSQIVADISALQTSVSGKVDAVSGMGLSQNSFTDAEKTKLAGIETGANKITVDSSLDSASTNPVQNKAVQAPLVRLVDAGTKNLLDLQSPIDVRSVTAENTDNGGVVLSVNNATWTAYNCDFDTVAGTRYKIVVYVYSVTGSGTSAGYVRNDNASGNNLLTINRTVFESAGVTVYEFTATTNKTWLGIYPNNSGTATTKSIKLRVMVCTAEDYAISSKFVPYKPSLQTQIGKLVDAGAKNHISFTVPTKTVNGLTFTKNDDGSITVNGTASAQTLLYATGSFAELNNTPIVLSGCYTGGDISRYFITIRERDTDRYVYDIGNSWHGTISGGFQSVMLGFRAGITMNNAIFRPMLCTAEDYEASPEFVPYKPSLQTQIGNLVDAGAKNLIDILHPSNSRLQTIIENANGTYTLSGSGTWLAWDVVCSVKQGTKYIFRCNFTSVSTDGNGVFVIKDANNSDLFRRSINNDAEIETEIEPSTATVTIGFSTNNGSTSGSGSFTMNPMLCTAEDYEASPEFVPYTPTMREMYENKSDMSAVGLRLVASIIQGSATTYTYQMNKDDFDKPAIGTYIISIMTWSMTPKYSLYAVSYTGDSFGHTNVVKIAGDDMTVTVATNGEISVSGLSSYGGKISIHALQ